MAASAELVAAAISTSRCPGPDRVTGTFIDRPIRGLAPRARRVGRPAVLSADSKRRGAPAETPTEA